MGTYRFEGPKKEKEIPSGWRGIGCLLIIILPVISYSAAVELLKVNSIYVPFARAMPSLFGPITVPPLLWQISSLIPLWNWLRGINNLGANLVIGFIVLVILSGIVSVIYATMYRAVAPSRYGPTDAPPPKRSKGRQKCSR